MRAPKSLGVRLTSIFSSVFVLFVAILLVSTHMFLDRSLAIDEQRALESRLLSYWSTYRYGGLAGLRRELTAERVLSEERPFMLRIVTPWNAEVVRVMPSSWTKFAVDRLSEGETPEEGAIVTLRSLSDRTSLRVAGVVLPDGYTLQIGISNARRVDILSQYRRVALLIALPLAVLSVAGGYLFASRSLAPITALSRLTRSIIATGDLDTRIPVAGTRDELGELARLFNQMLSRIESLVEGIRRSLDNVAHDLRTPLTRLHGLAERALEAAADPEEYRAALSAAMEESARMQTMLSALMDISEAETGTMRLSRSTVDLSALVSDIAELYGYTAEEKGVAVTVRADEAVEASVDVDRVRQAVANLLDNAVKYTPAGGAVEVSVRRGADRPSSAEITVADSGIGIEEKDLPQIWDRLFRGDRSRSEPGLGLGLATVQAVVIAHGGEVAVESTAGEGSTFVIRLPGAS